jgi:N-acetylglucosaminyldiphosphoundecaprenol N-acetyl-beta-D-mannosaminyltransferase
MYGIIFAEDIVMDTDEEEAELEPEEQCPQPDRLELLKVHVDALESRYLDATIAGILHNGGGKNLVLLSLWDMLAARRRAKHDADNPPKKVNEYRKYVQNAALVLPISHSIQRGCNFLLHRKPERYIPFEFVVHVLSTLEREDGTVYLLGGSESVLRVTEHKLQQTFPKLGVVGRYPGHFRKSAEFLILEAIRKASPSLLLVGRGVRGGEKWLARNDKKLNDGLRLWCSDVFEVFSGKHHRVSKGMYQHNMEWLGFFFRQPLRFFRLIPWLYYDILLLVARLKKKNPEN